MFGRLGGTLSTSLSSLPWYREDQKCNEDHSMVVNYAQTLHKQDVSDLPAQTKLSSACIPVCVPLAGCYFGDPLAGKVAKINLIFVFQPWVYDCHCCLPVLTHTDTSELLLHYMQFLMHLSKTSSHQFLMKSINVSRYIFGGGKIECSCDLNLTAATPATKLP